MTIISGCYHMNEVWNFSSYKDTCYHVSYILRRGMKLSIKHSNCSLYHMGCVTGNEWQPKQHLGCLTTSWQNYYFCLLSNCLAKFRISPMERSLVPLTCCCWSTSFNLSTLQNGELRFIRIKCMLCHVSCLRNYDFGHLIWHSDHL